MSSTPSPSAASDENVITSLPEVPPESTLSSSSSSLLELETSSLVTLGLVLVPLLYFLWQYLLSRSCPPGPWGMPFLGYLYVLGSPDKRKLFAELRAEHGNVFSFRLGCRLIVVVNRFEPLRQAFGLQQGYSLVDRPQVFTFTHVGQGKGLVHNSGEAWKEHRKFTLNTLRNLGIGRSSFADKIQEELEVFVSILDMAEDRDFDPANALQTAIANVVCSIAFGKRFDYDDPTFVRFLNIFDENMSISGGMALLNFFPFLHYLPGDRFKSHKVLRNVEYVQRSLRQWLDTAKRRFDPENVNDFIDAYFKEMKDRKDTTFSYDQLLKLVGDLLVGGTETTGTTLRWMLIFLVRWPHVQRKMRQEIDTVYPEKEKPSIQDRRKLPYVEAAIMESQRFADIAPFSLSHSASEDVEVDGLMIPKGSIVIPNVHSVHFDPELWGDPDDFRPDRFLHGHGEVVKPDYLIPFFMGKRSCPGERLATMELFLFITTILQRYEIRPASEGKLPSLEGNVGITFTPFPYKLRFIRRDQPPPEEEEAEIDDSTSTSASTVADRADSSPVTGCTASE